jgi:gamma-glutamyltranspeptidase / glutathione hydrolase
VDAALASTFAAFVTEGPLTGPAGGGFLLLYEPGGEPTVLDCFFAVPSAPAGEMDEVVIDFADASTQVFHVGEGSVAVPGLMRGLEEAHSRRGRIPWGRLFVPALELAARPFATTAAQAFLHEILVPILQREDAGRRIYGTAGVVDATGLVAALRLLRDVRGDAVAILVPELAEDIDAYELEERRPLEGPFAGTTVVTTPPPSLGGHVVRTGLAALDAAGDGPPGSPLDATMVARALAAGYGDVAARGDTRPTGTTHVSVIDSDGAAVGLSSTLGSGSGVFRHGFQLNNMLGELDVIGTDPRDAGTRLPSMMTPTVALDGEGSTRLVAGSAGSVRLAGAILQVVAAVIRHGLPVADAIARPRLHVDGDTVHVEGGWPEQVAEVLTDDGFEVRSWADRNLFFGGVSAVEQRPDGSFGAAGDPRRGGRGLVIR